MTSIENVAASCRKAVVVHAGARDSYQVVMALWEAGLLERFVTNVFSESWVKENYGLSLPRSFVSTPLTAAAAFVAMRLLKRLDIHTLSDAALSRTAREVARRRKAALFCYSYYAYHAFKPGAERSPIRLLYQLHPHPVSVRSILQDELQLVPEAKASLLDEQDIKRTGRSFAELSEEPALATGVIVASSFTKNTLVDNGIPEDRITIVPYGVEASKFPCRTIPASREGPLRVMWLGQLTQRKGLSYFLEAMRRFRKTQVTVVIRGRGQVDRNLLSRYTDLDLDIEIGCSREAVIREMHRSHLYVLPSLVEGFGQTILEAMSCGLPVIATDHTCAADIVRPGVDGFVVPIRSSEAIVERLEWCLHHRESLEDMGREASINAAQRTWTSFRDGIRQAYLQMATGVDN